MFSNYDALVLIILIMSATLATYRGMVREIFSFVCWIGAAILTFMFYPRVADLMHDSLKSGIIISMIAIVITYFSAFFLLSGVSALLLDFSRDMRGGPVDRSAGLMFGVFRGLLIISLMHYCVVQVQGGPPGWLKKSEFFTLSDNGSQIVGKLINEYVEASGERFGLKDKAGESVEERLDEGKDTLPQGEELQQMDNLDQKVKKTIGKKQFTPDE